MKYYKTRKWEVSIKERQFENALVRDGYEIKGLREFKGGMTDYLISKDDVEFEFRYYRDTKMNDTQVVKLVGDYYKLNRAYNDLLKSTEGVN